MVPFTHQYAEEGWDLTRSLPISSTHADKPQLLIKQIIGPEFACLMENGQAFLTWTRLACRHDKFQKIINTRAARFARSGWMR